MKSSPEKTLESKTSEKNNVFRSLIAPLVTAVLLMSPFESMAQNNKTFDEWLNKAREIWKSDKLFICLPPLNDPLHWMNEDTKKPSKTWEIVVDKKTAFLLKSYITQKTVISSAVPVLCAKSASSGMTRLNSGIKHDRGTPFGEFFINMLAFDTGKIEKFILPVKLVTQSNQSGGGQSQVWVIDTQKLPSNYHITQQ